jgi:hypothetical protein
MRLAHRLHAAPLTELYRRHLEITTLGIDSAGAWRKRTVSTFIARHRFAQLSLDTNRVSSDHKRRNYLANK